ncbi:hypothetical protein PybrP1_004863 [[Pythium] brassicae (nom. inval.)]|nr:hypothetical protein PybrP1_004863 [[Pythium] brassicae (nom. inval.)]
MRPNRNSSSSSDSSGVDAPADVVSGRGMLDDLGATSESRTHSSPGYAGARATAAPGVAVADDADHHTIVDMSLRTTRYMVVLAIGLGFALAYAIFSFEGTTLRSKVYEPEGSSEIADNYVEHYSAISGPLMFAVSKILEFYLETLVFPTLMTYLHNCSFFPGDQPHRVESKVKSNVLYWMFKVIFILINVGLASLYVSQLSDGVDPFISSDDVFSAPPTFYTFAADESAPPDSALANPMTLDKTLLKTVITGYTEEFELRTQCGAVKHSNADPSIDQIDSTSLSVGFYMNEWSSGLLVAGLGKPTASIEFSHGQYKSDAAKYNAAAAKTLNITLAVETFAQGTILFEQSVGNMDLTLTYNCTLTNSTTMFPAQCSGVPPQILSVLNITANKQETLENLVKAIVRVANNAIPQSSSTDGIKMGFHSYAVTDKIRLETITLDIPLEGKYGLDKVEFDGANRSVPVHFLDTAECGTTKCVYKSFNTKSFIRNEVSLTPFLAGCANRIFRDRQLDAFEPSNCSAVPDAAMLYGIGSYLTADSLELDSTQKRRKLVNPKAFVSLSFAKLSWREEQLSVAHGAECTDKSHCLGLSMPLLYKDGEGVLLLGKEYIARKHENSTMLRPLRLLRLNSVFVPLLSEDDESKNEFAMSVINPENVGFVAPGVFGSGAPPCDSLVDSYIDHDAVATEFVKVDPKKVNSKMRLNLDEAWEVKEITFSIGPASAIATFVGCLLMILLSAALIFLPTSRVKQSPNTTPAAQYVQILTDDMYPDLIHKKRLRFENGDALLMNEYVVDNIVLHAKRDHAKKIYL